MYALLMAKHSDPNKMSHAELHALVAREIKQRLDEEARQWREQQKQKEGQ